MVYMVYIQRIANTIRFIEINQKMIEHLKALHEEHIKNSGTTENDGPIQPTDSTEL